VNTRKRCYCSLEIPSRSRGGTKSPALRRGTGCRPCMDSTSTWKRAGSCPMGRALSISIDPQRCETCRSARGATDEVRVGDQSQDSEGHRTDHPADSAPTGRSGDQVAMLDQRGQLLRAALGFAGCSMPSYDRALWALRTWLDFSSGNRVRRGRPRVLSPESVSCFSVSARSTRSPSASNAPRVPHDRTRFGLVQRQRAPVPALHRRSDRERARRSVQLRDTPGSGPSATPRSARGGATPREAR
jgi:hypothetical protein